MGIGKEQFIKATGGFRLGESPEAFRARVCAIQELEQSIKSGKFMPGDELDLAHRKLCDLKGINFDGADDLDE